MPELEVRGPNLLLRYPSAADAAALFETLSDPAVTRWSSWGPYSLETEAEAYIASLQRRRDGGEALDFVVVHGTQGVVGLTGIGEVSRRNRHATVGTWFGRAHWGSGMNLESKALIAELAFERLGLDRLTAWSNTRNGRSQRALERAGFRREGVLRDWHRHGDELHDVVVFGLTRRVWLTSALREVDVRIAGQVPDGFVLA